MIDKAIKYNNFQVKVPWIPYHAAQHKDETQDPQPKRCQWEVAKVPLSLLPKFPGNSNNYQKGIDIA